MVPAECRELSTERSLTDPTVRPYRIAFPHLILYLVSYQVQSLHQVVGRATGIRTIRPCDRVIRFLKRGRAG